MLGLPGRYMEPLPTLCVIFPVLKLRPWVSVSLWLNDQPGGLLAWQLQPWKWSDFMHNVSFGSQLP